MSLLQLLADEKIAVALIIGFSTMFVKFVLRPMFKVIGKKLMRIRRAFLELIPNGGNSMWDKIDRIDKRTETLSDNQMTGLHLIRLVASNVSKIMWTADKNGEVDWVNEHWVERTGIPAQQAIGYGWLNGVHAEDREWVVEAWNAAVRMERDFNETFRLEHDKTGIETTVKARSTPVKDASSHRIAGWTGTMMVLTIPPTH